MSITVTKPSYFKHNYLKYIFLLLSIISFILMTMSIYNYYHVQQRFFNSMQEYATIILNNSIEKINKSFLLLEQIGHEIADKIDKQEFTPSNLEEKLKSILQNNPNIFGVGVIYEPYQANKDKKTYAPYVIRKHNQILSYSMKESDYIHKDWYQDPLKHGAMWMEPYLGSVSNTTIAEYALPFYVRHNNARQDTQQTKPDGVIIINYNLEKLQNLISALPLGKTGYGFIIGRKGTYASHPLKEYLSQTKTIFDKARQKADTLLAHIATTALSNTEGYREYKDFSTGKDTWIFYKQIPANKWPLFITFVKDEILDKQSIESHRNLIKLLINIILFLLFLSMLIAKVYTGIPSALWSWSIFISIVFLSAIIMIWHIQLYTLSPIIDTDTVIFDKTSLEQFLSETIKDKDIIDIPTGIFIDYIKLSDLNQASIVGSLWQKFPEDKAMLSKNFIFPLADETDKNLIINKTYNGTNLISWNFDTTLYQQFNYKKFPFDYKHISIHIKPQDIKNDIILTPDLQAYNFTNPSSLPGINPKFKLANWHLVKSYFSYEQNINLTDPQIAEYLGESKAPQLIFNIVLQRFFVHSFISYIIPLILALIFLFFVLRSTAIGKVEKPIKVDTILNPVALTISIFFAVILAHLSLRSSLAEQPLFYLEYFYIIAYIIMLIVLIILFGIITQNKSFIIKYENTLIPQILYWPLLLGLCLLATLWIFY